MAQSARTASLRAYRNYYGTSEKRKVLEPNSLVSSANSIAKRTANAELQSYIDRYNDGLISNSDFQAYLLKQKDSPLYSAAERVDIQDNIRDLDTKIQVESLKASYQTAQGYDKVSAAKALAAYYNNQANTMESGTPAQSKVLQEGASWESRAQTDENQILTSNRKLLRAQEFYQVAQEAPNTVEALNAKARAYDTLSAQAMADGDQVEATNYATQAQNTRNAIPALSSKMDRADRLDQWRQIQDAYHDGKISLEDAAVAAYNLNEVALQAEDTSLMSAINSFADRLSKDREKGTTVGDIEGLPFITRGTTGGTSSIKEMRKVFSLEDDNYRTAKRQVLAIPDATVRYTAMVKLQAAYLYGVKPNDIFPDGFEGLTNRKLMWEQLGQQYTNKDYSNQSRDAQEKTEVIEIELGHNVATLESIAPGAISKETAQGILGEILSAPPEGLGQQQPGSLQQGIMVSYDKYGNKYEKVINLNEEYLDSETGMTIKTKVGRDIGMITDENGQQRWVKLTEVYDPQDPYYPQFSYANVNGRLMVPDPNTGEMKPAAEVAQMDQNISKWYQEHQAEETWKAPEVVPEAPKPIQPNLISPISQEEIQKMREASAITNPPGQPGITSLTSGAQIPQAVVPAGTQFTPTGQQQVMKSIQPISPQPITMGQVQQQNKEAERLTMPQVAGPNQFSMAGISPQNINLGKPITMGQIPAIPQQKPNLFQQLKIATAPAVEKVKSGVSNLFQKLKFW